ncbi:MAG: hypothetical protein IPL63_11910 [Saprospiraceae bacterium]|nr:hypothetical protein [Saprospiraceae bacterium]
MYDRWADLVYKTKAGESIDWDGSFAGSDTILRGYVYFTDWRDLPGNLHVVNGDVTLPR